MRGCKIFLGIAGTIVQSVNSAVLLRPGYGEAVANAHASQASARLTSDAATRELSVCRMVYHPEKNRFSAHVDVLMRVFLSHGSRNF